MAEIIKSIEQIEDIFRLVVLKIFKLDPEAKENQQRVRFPWGSNLGKEDNDLAPLLKRIKDVCVISIIPREDLYNRQRHRRYEDRGERDLILIEEHTDVHEVTFCNYGEHAYEFARKIRDGLFDLETRRYLKNNNFALVTDVPAMRRVPEYFNNQWWNRCDITVVFNEFVRLESTVKTIESINVQVRAVINGEEIKEDISENL
jgi:hypothetical protein